MPTEYLTLGLLVLNVVFCLLAYLLNARLETIKAVQATDHEHHLQEKVQLEERIRALEARREQDIAEIFKAVRNVADDISGFRVAQLRELSQVGTEIRAELTRLQLMISTQYVTTARCDQTHGR